MNRVEKIRRTFISSEMAIVTGGAIAATMLNPFEAATILTSVSGDWMYHFLHPNTPNDIIPLIPQETMRGVLVENAGKVIGSAGALAGGIYAFEKKLKRELKQ